MLAYFRRCIYELAERLPMSKEAAEAAISTQCGFANSAPDLSLHHADRLDSHASAPDDLYALKFFFH